MKKQALKIVCFLLLICLSGCSGKYAQSDTWWNKAMKEESVQDYVKYNRNEIDLEVLKKESNSEKLSLEQQLTAIILLCEVEYQDSVAENGGKIPSKGSFSDNIENERDVFKYHYPVSNPYICSYLAKVKTEPEEFWKALTSVRRCDDYFVLMFAAAEDIDGETLGKLIKELPEGYSFYESSITEAVKMLLQERPGQLPQVGDGLIESGYFSEQTYRDIKQSILSDKASKRLETSDHALQYISYLRNRMFPMLEAEFPEEDVRYRWELTGERLYSTRLALSIDEELELKDLEEKYPSEVIETAGKKVIAYYHIPPSEKSKDSPESLRIVTDFMLNLPNSQFPESADQADYHLVLTPEYFPGEKYKDRSGKEGRVRKINSFTSIELYDAKTGELLRNLGYITEEPSEILVLWSDDNKTVEYPKFISVDELKFIYDNINNPTAYASYASAEKIIGTELHYGEPIILKNWEVKMNSYELVDTFNYLGYNYTVNEGFRLGKVQFSVTNLGTNVEKLRPILGQRGQELLLELVDSKKEAVSNRYDVHSYVNGLNKSKVLPNETVTGEMFFEIPIELLDSQEQLYVRANIGPQEVFFKLNEEN